MPTFRQYPQVTSLEPTDAFILDRQGVGTVWIEDPAIATPNWTTPEAFGAVGNGIADDTAAFTAAIATGATIMGKAGSNYLVADLVNPTSIIDLNGAMMSAAPGANWCVKNTGQGAVIRNGYINDPDLETLYATTTTQTITGNSDPNVAIGTPISFTVADASKLAIGKLIALTQSNGHHFVTKVTNIVGLTVTIPDTPLGNVGNGAVVETAHGLIIMDQALNGRVENINMPVCPVGIELVNTVTPALSHEMTVQTIRMDAYYLCGIYRDVDVATAHFINIVGYGHAGSNPAYVGYHADGRLPGLYPTGGNEHTDINFEGAEHGWQLFGCQLDEFHNCVGDTEQYRGWLIADVCQKLRFTSVWAGFITGSGGIGMQVCGGSLGIFLNGLYTRINDTADLYVDPTSQVYLIDETWGESQTFAGGGTYNQVFPTHLGGAPGNESLRITNATYLQVNRWEMQGNISTFGPILSVTGTDTNIDAFYITKGTGAHVFENNVAATPATLLIVNGPTTAARYVEIQAAAAGSTATINTNAGDLALNSATGVLQFANVNSFSANASVATVLGSVGPVGSHTTVQEWLTFKNAAGLTRYVPAF